MTTALADQIIEVAHRFSAPEYARAGGGNASYKEDGILHIKPSGMALQALTVEDLVPLHIDVLLDALHSEDPVDVDPVRAAAERARVGLYDGRRPSVEILFHAMMPEPLVLHLHPLTASALTCNRLAPELARSIFSDDAIFVEYAHPGVALARAIEEAREAYTRRTGQEPPALTLLRNNGMVVAGKTAQDVSAVVDQAMSRIRAAINARPPTPPPAPSRIGNRVRPAPVLDEDERRRVADMILVAAPLLRGLLGTERSLAVVTSDSSELVRSETRMGKPVVTDGPLTPDQIVYAGAMPCVVEPRYAPLADQIRKAVASYRLSFERDPVIVVLPGRVAFAAGPDHAAARNALETFTDALAVARDANRLGEVRVMDADERGFIETWEAEAYRKKMAETAYRGRMQHKVAVITGAAQGFGLGIARGLAAEGAHVVLADLNLDLAQAEARRLVAWYGPGTAMAVQVNVADENSQKQALAEVLAAYGGLDLFVSNAGIARAGSVTEQRIEDFDLVTSINYKGYFLGVRAVSPVLAAQHEVRPDLLFDIVEINSKSGLEGSNRNFAYAGSKFGGIGLTQSFALELIEAGIKVNSVCPGNYLDGPLWSDSDTGLFVQYLRAGKVPGASDVDQVRAFYESKVPMVRGCLPEDVVCAVLYLVEQQYETGQALTVTGGQTMRN
ncbi:MAG: SDR family NAD(P)-dependent oxidoreductase [Propionibacteriaceae bacterium]|nr:SDR family NAD(P)-dependent oxidoreductase [Propionibacteriaceae bacterium]